MSVYTVGVSNSYSNRGTKNPSEDHAEEFEETMNNETSQKAFKNNNEGTPEGTGRGRNIKSK